MFYFRKRLICFISGVDTGTIGGSGSHFPCSKIKRLAHSIRICYHEIDYVPNSIWFDVKHWSMICICTQLDVNFWSIVWSCTPLAVTFWSVIWPRTQLDGKFYRLICHLPRLMVSKSKPCVFATPSNGLIPTKVFACLGIVRTYILNVNNTVDKSTIWWLSFY